LLELDITDAGRPDVNRLTLTLALRAVVTASCALYCKHDGRTLDDKQRGGDDARDDVCRQTFVDALVVPRQLDNRQVADVLQRSC